MIIDVKLVQANLFALLSEVRAQSDIGDSFPPELQSFPEQIEQIREWVEDVGEYAIAYESLVSMLDAFPFRLSSKGAIRLLEVGLLMRFKTEQPQDSQFDSR